MRRWVCVPSAAALVCGPPAEPIDVPLQRIGGNAAKPTDPHRLDLASGDQRVHQGAADTEPISSLLHGEDPLVGDSDTDITAARRAGTAVVAYANKPGKHDLLAAHRPDAVIDDLHELVAAAKLPHLS
jgi:hypothetical protein